MVEEVVASADRTNAALNLQLERACAEADTLSRPVDPLDVEYDGVKLRDLLEMRAQVNREKDMPRSTDTLGYAWRVTDPWTWTPAQRAAVSAHWSAQLRAKVDASKAAALQSERARFSCDPRDSLDLED